MTTSDEPCAVCDGLGYLMGQSYRGDSATAVQRCDACARYPGDIEAAQAAAHTQPVQALLVRWLENNEWRVLRPDAPVPDDALIDEATDVEVVLPTWP